MKNVVRSVMGALITLAAVVGLFCVQATGAGVALAADHVLVLGGNANSAGLYMENQLEGYYSGKPGTHYDGYQYEVVPWSAQLPGSPGADGVTTWDASQLEGVYRINSAIGRSYTPGDKIVAVGYSSSAAVITKELRLLQAARDTKTGATPDPGDLSFIVFGNPNRPNGGLLARFPGFVLGKPFGVPFDGAAPTTDYQVTDIATQYDGFADFPTDPTNILAVANAVVGAFLQHGNYYNVDLDDPSTFLQDQIVGNTRYITIRATWIPLLRPISFIPSFLLRPVDTFLRKRIEKAYDRAAGPGTPVTAKGWTTPTTAAPTTAAARMATTKASVVDVEDTTESTTTTIATTTAEAPRTTTASSTSVEATEPTTSSDPTLSSTPTTISTPASITASTPQTTKVVAGVS